MFTQSCTQEKYPQTCLRSLVQRRITPKHVYTVLYKGELPLNMFTQSCTTENYP